ncbi:molecular chaperone HtpG [Pseudoalteromonas sp. NBT06-2]|uniref:molecular chaperone HtpG n=1 Tax=Pseudoalteromonas sp. NBT06-2 TaxID=2025950 RepID=UPI000BA75609|nr:molecular chaperone HtpG [Pseudoalteromonas sp. NBT06-2]PAJ74392.1 molecular chaperone HtpG [Pseudoalteromonas sp. NBT06-2]
MTAELNKENHSFGTDAKQILNLMIHSLYSNKEIFLRELISNASDAADKLRFLALSDGNLYQGDAELKLRISTDEKAGTVTISDNGIGMNRDEVISSLGTIAKSGTAEFFENLSGDQAKDSQLIGQFGVGFYSAFIVADAVTVRTRKAGEEKATEWHSKGEGEYTIAEIEKESRGTEITLHLKEEEKEFVELSRLRGIVTKYADHISIPVQMFKDEVPESEGPDGEKIDAIPAEWETINKATALWTLDKSEIEESEYKEFYKHVSHDWEEPLTWTHNKVEGKTEYTSLLYIPKKAPFDLWNRDHKSGLKLYVQRVFIMDDAEQFMPSYLRFVKGLLDSNDLPLNVSREILQDNKVTQAIRKGCTSRILKILDRMGKNKAEDYQVFWNEFGQVIKEGPAEDAANKDAISKLLRFASTDSNESIQSVSLTDYVSRMKEGQDKIYYVVSDNFAAAKSSPHLEIFRKKGIEVLLMSDRVDEWMMSHLTEFDSKQLTSITRGDLDLGDLDDEESKKEQENSENEVKGLAERIKTVLGDKVKEVRFTHRLTDSPACVVADENDMSSQMAKLMEAVGQGAPEAMPVFELNPEHQLVKHLNDEQDEEKFSQWSEVLLDQALLAERGSLKDPAGFVSRLNKLMLDLSK